MKNLIIYSSITGHSKKLANAIAKQLDINVLKITKHLFIDSVDTLFIVGGIYGGESNHKIINLVNQLNHQNVKQVVLITSSASNKVGQNKVRMILEQKQIKVVDEYRCLGNFLFFRLKHPNQDEITAAVNFSQKIIENKYS